MSFDEKERGSLEVGKIADIVMLSANPYEISVTELEKLCVEQLLVQGVPYSALSQNPMVQVLKGMLS